MPAWLPPGGDDQPKSAEMKTSEHEDIPLGDRVNLQTLPSSRRSKVPASMKIGSRIAGTAPNRPAVWFTPPMRDFTKSTPGMPSMGDAVCRRCLCCC